MRPKAYLTQINEKPGAPASYFPLEVSRCPSIPMMS